MLYDWTVYTVNLTWLYYCTSEPMFQISISRNTECTAMDQVTYIVVGELTVCEYYSWFYKAIAITHHECA